MEKVNGHTPLSGIVEVDESHLGGYQPRKQGSNKTLMIGMAQRGGPVVAKVIPNLKAECPTTLLGTLVD
jgi:hypothetical protein